jgi:hypothetical protein
VMKIEMIVVTHIKKLRELLKNKIKKQYVV